MITKKCKIMDCEKLGETDYNGYCYNCIKWIRHTEEYNKRKDEEEKVNAKN